MKLMVFSSKEDVIEQEMLRLTSLVENRNITSEFYNTKSYEGMQKAIQHNVFGSFQLLLLDDHNKVRQCLTAPLCSINELHIE
ncbi:MAG: hypothetical protein WC755_04005 [Candidatus Woesearchaeota archaeon]|jgi:hypothetical protein